MTSIKTVEVFIAVLITCCYWIPVTSSVSLALDSPLVHLSLPNHQTEVQCTDSRDWGSPTLDPIDCLVALDLLNIIAAREDPSEKKEFISHDVAHKRTTCPLEWIPWRIQFGTCTIDINLLSSIGEPLPGEPSPPFPPTDVTTWQLISEAVSKVLRECRTPRPHAGWIAVGEERGLGVFVLGVDSRVDRLIGTEEVGSLSST